MMHKAKKSLGQNFLKSGTILKKIVAAGEVSTHDTVLEIGPGKGTLTAKLLESAGQVLAVEKDRSLVEFLKEKFENEISIGKLILAEADILKFTPPKKYKIIANIPYNITGAILKKFLSENPSTTLRASQPTLMVLMVQYEVAKRILASNNKNSILSISVKAYGEPKLVMKVPARYFSPQPKVDSAIISIKNISRQFFSENKIEESFFWEIIHAGFAHKRKKLGSNLKKLHPFLDEASLKMLGNKRAEDLSLADWLSLMKKA
jgi:16S rRNA (adenine1518-N6/adenine1519-N6)-dimethyltransferase